MIFTRSNDNGRKPPTLQAAIVEPVLMACLEECFVCELYCKIQTILPLPYYLLKIFVLFD